MILAYDYTPTSGVPAFARRAVLSKSPLAARPAMRFPSAIARPGEALEMLRIRTLEKEGAICRFHVVRCIECDYFFPFDP